MDRADPGFLVVGHVAKPHGIKGAVSVTPLTDHPEAAFAVGVTLLPAEAGGSEPDPRLSAVRIASSQPFRAGFLLSLEGIEDRDQAEALRGRYLLQPIEDVEPLAEGEVFYHQLLGMEVVTVEGARVGEVVEVYDLAPVDLLEVRGSSGKLLVPFRREIVVAVDVDARRVTLDPPEGLLDL